MMAVGYGQAEKKAQHMAAFYIKVKSKWLIVCHGNYIVARYQMV